MTFIRIAILLILFIFGITAQVYSNSVKSMNIETNQETIMKMNENRVGIQKKKGSVKKTATTLKYCKLGSQSGIAHKNVPWTTDNAKINFLKTLEEKKKNRFADSLDFVKMVFSYEFSQNVCTNKFLSHEKVVEIKSSNSGSSQSILKLNLTENKYFGGEGLPATFKLLPPRKPETFKEIFTGFYLSFDTKNGDMFLEMNVSSSSEKGPGFVIPLRNEGS